MFVYICFMLGSVMQHHCMFVVFVSAQESAKLWLAYLAPAMAHDEQSLATIAANSAVASRSRVHELLGRNDVKVSCACPMCYACACLLMPLSCCSACVHPHKIMIVSGITGLRKNATG